MCGEKWHTQKLAGSHVPSHHGVGSYTSVEQWFLSLCLPCIAPLLFLSLLHVSTSATQELNILFPGPYYSDVEWWNQKPGLQLFGSSLKFFWQQPGSLLYLWPAIWNCFMKHITKILVFLLLFFTVRWGHLSSLLMFSAFRLPQAEAFISVGNSFYIPWETVYFLMLWYM